MRRISDDLFLTHLEVALAVAPEHTLARLNADDPRVQRGARVDLARHLVERMRGFRIEGDASGPSSAQIHVCFQAIYRRSDERDGSVEDGSLQPGAITV
jgi:hypothetical protein